MEHFSMRGRFVLVAGSASPSCKLEQLRKAHEFVRFFTRHVLEAGAGVVVFASSEPTHTQDQLVPLVFDWTVLGEVNAYLRSNGGAVRQCARIVTSNKAMTIKLDDPQRALISRLSALQAADIAFIADDLHTGGNIGDKQVEWAHAMVVVSGGKGVADRAAKLRRKAAPIVALDIDLGSTASDGLGGVGLHRRCLTAPTEFLPHTGSRLPGIIPSMSLMTRSAEPSQVASIVTSLLTAEFNAQNAARPIDVLLLTALPVELNAAQRALGLQATSIPQRTRTGTLYWVVDIASTSSARTLRVGLSCFGSAGNVGAAATTTELMSSLSPRFVLMVGIAAGIRGKCKLGDVVLSDRLVAYEPSSVESHEEGTTQRHRPDIARLDHATEQCVAAYVSSGQALTERVTQLRAALGGSPPQGCDEREVAMELVVRAATIASGEMLLRSPVKFLELQEIHGKIEVVEMEGVGVFSACRIGSQPCIVVRGISDHGDNRKDDRFHGVAAKGAAVVAVDFIRNGLRLLPTPGS